jgi:adenylosuccinate lyase
VLEPAKYTGRCGAQVMALTAKLRPLLKDANENSEQIEL